MKTVVLEGSEIRSMADVHDILAAGLDFPEYYGRNLDALHDCLTDLQEPVAVQLADMEALEQTLGSGFRRLLHVLADGVEDGKVELEILEYCDEEAE